jgi:hypothetical protein
VRRASSRAATSSRSSPRSTTTRSKAPHVVDITTRVVSEDGRDVFKTSEERQSTELQGKPGGYGHATRIQTKEFAPGVYLLTVEARSRQGKSEPVGRTIPFRIY